MNWLDILLSAVILFSVLAAARKGLSREVIGLAASILALLCAVWFYRTAGARLEPWVSSHIAASLGGFLAIFFGVMILGAILSAVVSRVLKTVGLSMVDRVLGALYGLARGVLLGFGIVMGVLAAGTAVKGEGAPDAVVHSRLAPYLMELSGLAGRIAPEGLTESFAKQYARVKSSWESTAEPPAR